MIMGRLKIINLVKIMIYFCLVIKMLDKVLDNTKHVRINYDKANELISELLDFDNVHYLIKVPYDIYGMSTKDIVNFLLIYDAIDFSF